MLYLSDIICTLFIFVLPLKLKIILFVVAGFVQIILQEVARSFSATGESENDKAWDRGIECPVAQKETMIYIDDH